MSKDLTEAEIDEIVIAQVDDEFAWEEAIGVQVEVPAAISLPSDLAARAAFFARLHDMPDVESWLQQIIRERIQFEESAFVGLKQILEKKATYRS